jgi:guanylate kinase
MGLFGERFFMTNKIYAFIGPLASGKYMLLRQLISMGLNYIPIYTTRQLTKNETKTNLYHYIDKTEFFKQSFIVKITYKGDYYGILKKDVLDALQTHKISMIILDINGIKQLNKLLKNNLDTIYIMCDYITIVERMLRMGYTNADIKYHLEYAESNGEFDSWKTAQHVIKNISNPHTALNQVLAIMGLMTVSPKENFSTLNQHLK